jgi:hypothetical protein
MVGWGAVGRIVTFSEAVSSVQESKKTPYILKRRCAGFNEALEVGYVAVISLMWFLQKLM